jgi:hypothetical protein
MVESEIEETTIIEIAAENRLENHYCQYIIIK